jgi:glycosyltransferase involved in cell wall biosynthesis
MDREGSEKLVSVIVPVYNVEAYLGVCLDSLAAQTYGNFEVIMVDDGSTDGSAELCRNMALRDARFKLLSKPNGGPSLARNAGMTVAAGEFVTFVDSDDVVHPKYLETLMQTARRDVYAMVCVAMARFTDELPMVDTVDARFYHYLPDDALKEMLYQTGAINNSASACGKIYRCECIADIRFKDGIQYEDLEWMARVLSTLSRAHRVGVIGAPYYFYRWRSGSFLTTFTPRRLDVLCVTREIEERAQQVGDTSLVRAARDRRFSANFDMYLQLCRVIRNDAPLSGENPLAARYAAVQCECWHQIVRLRIGALLNPRVRCKNKLGALLSLLGPRFCGFIGSRLVNRLKS